jgi:hypothetical protein
MWKGPSHGEIITLNDRLGPKVHRQFLKF